MRRRFKPLISKNKHRINNFILEDRTFEVDVISSSGDRIGVVKTEKAITLAKEEGLDLVEMTPNTKPPVCRVMDYGKFKYSETKKKKSNKLKQHVVKIKEIKLHPRTDTNDYQYRLEQGKAFLTKGHKLKVTVVFRGREIIHKSYGERWIGQIKEDLQTIADVEGDSKQEGRNLSIFFSPRKKVIKKQAPTTERKVKTVTKEEYLAQMKEKPSTEVDQNEKTIDF